MCYSAMVKQDVKELKMKFHVRIDEEEFSKLFMDRLAGSGAKIVRGMEAPFLHGAHTELEKKIAADIKTWNQLEIEKYEKEMFTQKKRLHDAERVLETKVTKKAQEEIRIATNKIEKAKSKWSQLNDTKAGEKENRVFPFSYVPLIVMEKGELVVKPFRYHLRPKGQGPEFDRKYDGCYNARKDNLEKGVWWRSLFGRKHGVLVITRFWENVAEYKFKKQKLVEGKNDGNVVLEFSPEGLDYLLVPCIYDSNQEGKFVLNSCALITDDPNPEVAAAGHDRTPIILKEEHLKEWLTPDPEHLEKFYKILADKAPTYFKHQVAA